MEKRVDNIVSLLTLEEKIDLLTGFQLLRLNITAPGSAEGIHQVVIRSRQPGQASAITTSFSQVFGLGSTWDPDLIKKAGNVMAYEGILFGSVPHGLYRRRCQVVHGRLYLHHAF
jgi:beta-glucosidase